MRRERIWATPTWQKGAARNDCIYVVQVPDLPGFHGLLAARVLLFFSLTYEGVKFPCALVRWYSAVDDEADPETGMWIVEPDPGDEGLDVIYLDTIFRAAHLIGLAGEEFIPHIPYTEALDAFRQFYVNKYADHHAYEIAF